MSGIATATPKAKRRKLFYYEIINNRTISVPDVPSPEVNADVFSDVSTGYISSLGGLILEISSCYPLSNHFGHLANDEAGNLQDELDSGRRLSSAQKKAMRDLISKLESDPADETGWKAWINASTPQELPKFKALIDDWLTSPINWNESDYFDNTWSGQGMAKNFFESEDSAICEALQIEIIEGDCPGSSYFAAELGLDIETANKVARRLKLDYRFKAGGSL